jgi:flagellar basal body P-ring formation protein FlgA
MKIVAIRPRCISIMFRMFVFALFASLSIALSATETSKQQMINVAVIQKTVENFVYAQTIGLPGKVNLKFGNIDPNLSLPACNSLEGFIPTGGRLWGDSNVGVRCNTPNTWTIYVPVTVRVMANIVVTAKPLSQGQAITSADVTTQIDDLTKMPTGIVTDPTQAIGKIMSGSVALGHPLRQDMLRSPPVILQGQTVKLLSQGRGFIVSSEGKALSNAVDGQVVQVRTYSGEVVSGIARPGPIVEIRF